MFADPKLVRQIVNAITGHPVVRDRREIAANQFTPRPVAAAARIGGNGPWVQPSAVRLRTAAVSPPAIARIDDVPRQFPGVVHVEVAVRTDQLNDVR